MEINLPPKSEAVIREAVLAGYFPSKEEALLKAIELFAKSDRLEQQSNFTRPTAADVDKILKTFLATQRPAGTPVDDSRESIYASED